eukprot:Sspe_Gene.109796::Locus_89962_Transcript_1_1_Confidence_1.000_Length_557::g.109796::m.109796
MGDDESQESPRPEGAKVKKLTEEELAKSLERLYQLPCEKRLKKLKDDKAEIEDNIKHNACRPKAREANAKDEKIVHRLYVLPMEHQKAQVQALEKRHTPKFDTDKGKKLTEDQAEETIQRLYVQSVNHKKQLLKNSEKKIYGSAPPSRKLDSVSLKENVSKLYDKA